MRIADGARRCSLILSMLMVVLARADDSTPLHRLDVPLRFDSVGRYVVDVSMVSGALLC